METHKYTQIADDSPDHPNVRPRSAHSTWHYAVCALLWALSLLAVYMTSVSFRPIAMYTYDDIDTRKHECGTSPGEARMRGCHWDPVSFAWLPERCLDRKLAHEFLTQTNWTLHADPLGKTVKTDEEFSQDSSPTWLTNANHVLHCIYSWKRLHNLLLAGKPYHSGLSLQHTHHCSEMLLENLYRDPREVRTQALVIYPAC